MISVWPTPGECEIELMNPDTLNKWLTLLANFGVIAGIIFLAFEVRQNEEMLRLQYELAGVDSASLAVSRYAAQRDFQLQNPELRDLYIDGLSGADLSSNDQWRFDNMSCRQQISCTPSQLINVKSNL